MKRTFICVLCTLLLSGSLCGCGGDTASSSELPALIGQLALPEGLEFSVPEGFSAQSSEMYEEYYVKDDASIIITEEPLEAAFSTAQSYADRAVEQYEQATDSFSLIARTPMEYTGAEGVTLEFSYTISVDTHQFAFHSLTGYLLTEDTAYIITCKAKEETFAAYRSAFADCIADAAPREPKEEST